MWERLLWFETCRALPFPCLFSPSPSPPCREWAYWRQALLEHQPFHLPALWWPSVSGMVL